MLAHFLGLAAARHEEEQVAGGEVRRVEVDPRPVPQVGQRLAREEVAIVGVRELVEARSNGSSMPPITEATAIDFVRRYCSSLSSATGRVAPVRDERPAGDAAAADARDEIELGQEPPPMQLPHHAEVKARGPKSAAGQGPDQSASLDR